MPPLLKKRYCTHFFARFTGACLHASALHDNTLHDNTLLLLTPRTMPSLRLLIALHASVAVLGNFEQAD